MRFLTALLLAGAAVFTAGSQAAQAADLPTKARPLPVAAAPVWSWTGLYIGAHVGGAWGTIESEFAGFGGGGAFPIASGTVNGFLGGGQIGYNFQSGIVVFGIEADASWSNLEGTTPCLFGALSCNREVDFLGTITGRLGFTADRALIYVKGGGAWAHVEHNATFLGGGPGFTLSADKTIWGWTVGTGVEYAITGNWSAKLEYNYMDFGTNSLGFSVPAGPGGTIDVDTTTSIHAVKFGVNYRFGGYDVARY
ncbi:MAG: outer membrane beta-barrel protein [Rhizobiales bacterium]|nr:outer membrane beta-barrel protein [Hyphomicrobiales bacterium]